MDRSDQLTLRIPAAHFSQHLPSVISSHHKHGQTTYNQYYVTFPYKAFCTSHQKDIREVKESDL